MKLIFLKSFFEFYVPEYRAEEVSVKSAARCVDSVGGSFNYHKRRPLVSVGRFSPQCHISHVLKLRQSWAG